MTIIRPLCNTIIFFSWRICQLETSCIHIGKYRTLLQEAVFHFAAVGIRWGQKVRILNLIVVVIAAANVVNICDNVVLPPATLGVSKASIIVQFNLDINDRLH